MSTCFVLLFNCQVDRILDKMRHWTYTQGYRFTKGLAQNLNLRTNLKLEYTIKIPQ